MVIIEWRITQIMYHIIFVKVEAQKFLDIYKQLSKGIIMHKDTMQFIQDLLNSGERILFVWVHFILTMLNIWEAIMCEV